MEFRRAGLFLLFAMKFLQCPECRMFYADLVTFQTFFEFEWFGGSTPYRSPTKQPKQAWKSAGLPEMKLILAILSRRMIITWQRYISMNRTSACLWFHRCWSLTVIRPPGTTVPDGLMFDPWCCFVSHSFSELPRPIAVKLCHMVGIWPNFIIQVQKFRGRSPKKLGPKHAKFQSILDHFRLWSRISPERGNTSKIGKMYGLEKFFLRLIKKVRWTLVH